MKLPIPYQQTNPRIPCLQWPWLHPKDIVTTPEAIPIPASLFAAVHRPRRRRSWLSMPYRTNPRHATKSLPGDVAPWKCSKLPLVGERGGNWQEPELRIWQTSAIATRPSSRVDTRRKIPRFYHWQTDRERLGRDPPMTAMPICDSPPPGRQRSPPPVPLTPMHPCHHGRRQQRHRPRPRRGYEPVPPRPGHRGGPRTGGWTSPRRAAGWRSDERGRLRRRCGRVGRWRTGQA